MKYSVLTLASVSIAATVLPFTAMAGPYLGAAGLLAERGYEDVDTSIGGKAFVGYRFEQVPLILEASYLNTGDGEVSDTGYDLNLKFTGFDLSLGYFWKLSDKGSGIWAKGGYYNGDTHVGYPFPEKLSAQGVSFGGGAVWKITPWFGLRAEVQGLAAVKDYAEDATIAIASAGIVLEIPTTRSAAPPPPAESNLSYAREPAVSAAPSQDVEAPAAPHSDQIGPGAWKLAQNAALKAQPQRQGAVRQVIPAGATIHAESRIANAEGGWWFVRYQGAGGWLQESALVNAGQP